MTPEDKIKEYLKDNREYLQEVTRPWMKQKNELYEMMANEFHSDIDKNYNDLIRGLLLVEVSKATAQSPEKILEVLEDIDYNQYLGSYDEN